MAEPAEKPVGTAKEATGLVRSKEAESTSDEFTRVHLYPTEHYWREQFHVCNFGSEDLRGLQLYKSCEVGASSVLQTLQMSLRARLKEAPIFAAFIAAGCTGSPGNGR